MKWLIGLAGLALLAMFLRMNGHKPPDQKPAAKNSFAVLELFTSEGCSSCPAADRLLPTLSADSGVIALSYHVDYWDRLGWKDRFSAAANTERQKQYAEQLKLESIYTPQLIVNGHYELVGSNAAGAHRYIGQALSETPSIRIHLDEAKREGNRLNVRCHLEGDPAKMYLVAAAVQKYAETAVKGGENKGAHLAHTNVVRTFVLQKAAASMQFSMDLPADLVPEQMSLILYTQRDNDLHITGALKN